jgi:hypothetical protein
VAMAKATFMRFTFACPSQEKLPFLSWGSEWLTLGY